MSKTILYKNNIASFKDKKNESDAETETETETEAPTDSERLISKRMLGDKLRHDKFMIDECKKEIIIQKTEKEILNTKVKKLETIAENQIKIRKELEKKNILMTKELNLIKQNTQKTYKKCDMNLKTDDINIFNSKIEEEVKKNLAHNKDSIIDEYLKNFYLKNEIS